MNHPDEVYAMYRHYLGKNPNKFYAANKTAALLSMNVEDVEAIVEQEQEEES